MSSMIRRIQKNKFRKRMKEQTLEHFNKRLTEYDALMNRPTHEVVASKLEKIKARLQEAKDKANASTE